MKHESDAYQSIAFIVDALRDDLNSAGRGIEVAWHTSGALHRLDLATAKRDAPRISEAQRDQLLEALVLAHGPILVLFKTPEDRTQAATGVKAAAGLIITWAESDEVRARRHPHVRTDLAAYARWLRNACHNLCLIADIEGRARDRRHTEIVSGIIRRACA